MTEVLTKQVCAAGTIQDMVGLKFGPQQFLLYYQTAFKLAAGLLMSAKLSARYEGVDPKKWASMVNTRQQEVLTPLHRDYRRTAAAPNFVEWSVSFERNLVVIKFDLETIKMHYSDAFALYPMIRLAGKNAKAWAGDRSRQWTTRASLTDAEENDKFQYVA